MNWSWPAWSSRGGVVAPGWPPLGPAHPLPSWTSGPPPSVRDARLLGADDEQIRSAVAAALGP
ncbi:hypothetical protein ACFFWC_31155 [Plantactinospora siamensis]|uniref:Uncharacterized protein n=1 Tax=Plantactinospora siamensis TaxID=555372 RepID=A0ABV6NYN0_9ACTN